MTLSKREKHILIFTAAVIALALLYNFLMEPFSKKWSAVNNEIIIKETALKKAVKLLDRRNEIINEYNGYSSSINNISKVLSYIEKQALSAGIKTSDIKPRPVAQKGLYREYIIELQIEGTLPGINIFASELLKPPTFITLKKFDLRMQKGTSSILKGTLILSKLLI